MNTYVQDLWFKALVGGAYEQTVGELRDGDAFCVSGVLCDLHRHATGFEWQQCESAYGDETWFYLGQSANVPQEVLTWAQLAEEDVLPLQDANDIGEDFATLADRVAAL